MTHAVNDHRATVFEGDVPQTEETGPNASREPEHLDADASTCWRGDVSVVAAVQPVGGGSAQYLAQLGVKRHELMAAFTGVVNRHPHRTPAGPGLTPFDRQLVTSSAWTTGGRPLKQRWGVSSALPAAVEPVEAFLTRAVPTYESGGAPPVPVREPGRPSNDTSLLRRHGQYFSARRGPDQADARSARPPASFHPPAAQLGWASSTSIGRWPRLNRRSHSLAVAPECKSRNRSASAVGGAI